MAEYALITLFALVTLATGLVLVDCWLRGKHAFLQVTRERALLSSGFVPVVAARKTRLRSTTNRSGFARRLGVRRPNRQRSAPVPALFAA